jgi:CubicO group peptidase (beta-lactamase class C family)
MRIKFLIGSLCLASMLTACGGGDSPPPPPPPEQPIRLLTGEALRAEVERVRAKHGLPGLQVVIVDQDRIETVSAGKRSVNGAGLVSDADQFQIGSLSKAATATLIAHLVEQKKLRWDSTMADIFPAWSGQMHASLRTVTLQQLLRHRSGIQRDISEADAVQLRPQASGNVLADRALVGKFFLQKTPEFAPGSKYSYSNNGYLIAGLIAEAAAGEPYEELMQKQVFAPLKMTATFGLPEDGGPSALHGHTPSGNAWQVAQYTDEQRQLRPLMAPAGGMMVSMRDYGNYLHEHLQGLQGKSSYLSPETFKLIHTPVDEYGFGWQVGNDPELGGQFSIHNGTILTYSSITIIAPGNNRAVAVSCNCYSETAMEQIGELMLRLAAAKP